jgi:hypothetical protein
MFKILQLYALPTLYLCFCIYLRKTLAVTNKMIGFITEKKSVYSAVWTGDLNKAVCACATYSIN